jgi:hypothetical protein
MSLQSGSSAGAFLLKQIPPGSAGKTFFQQYVVTTADQATLELAAQNDAFKYAYNGVVSLLGGVSGLYGRQASWAITKMYYSAFYIARATLCRNGLVIFHVPKLGTLGNTQFALKIAAGERASVSSISSTHKLVASEFRRVGYPSFMQGLIVDNLDPMIWLMEQREYWQYRSGRFPDPEFPGILAQADLQKVDRLLNAYEEDSRGVYLSDPDHAVLALPFRLVTWCLSETPLGNTGVLAPEDITYLRKSCMVGGRNLTAISRHFQG